MDNSSPSKFKLLVEFFIPSWVALILVLVIALNVLVFSHASQIWQQIVNDSNTNIETAKLATESYTVYINNALGNSVLGRATLMLFWAALGSIAYMAVWTLINIARKVEDEKEEANFVDGRLQKHQSTYWQSAIADQIFLGATVIASAFFAIILLRIIYPYTSALFESVIAQGSWASKLLTGGQSVVILGLGIYVMSLLFKTLRYAWRKVFISEAE